VYSSVEIINLFDHVIFTFMVNTGSQ